MILDLLQSPAHPSTIALAASLFVCTFILEDVAAIGAGLLLAAGSISWPAAFIACFLGIWSGDAGLYALARCGGRRWFEQSRFHRHSDKVERSETWFARRGTSMLIFSRMLPGARLPTYLAAGFLRIPLRPFLLVTGAASFVWTLLILWLSHSVGTRLTAWFTIYKHAAAAALAIALLGYVAITLLSRYRLLELGAWSFSGAWCLVFGVSLKKDALISRNRLFLRVSTFFGRLRHWEFWPAWMFYPPVAIYCVWLAFKYRGLSAPLSSNPGIFSGGLVGESKLTTLKDLSATSPEFTAEAELLHGTTSEQKLQSLAQICERRNIGLPFILKPDVGQRGVGVKLIRSLHQAESYLRQVSGDIILQRYAPGPHEVGVFYYRFPHEAHGHIFAITEKVFPSITGDGVSTVSELIWRDPRARLIAAKYLARFQTRLTEILPTAHTLKLVEAGDHAQGCIFRDGMHLLTPALAERIDHISQKLNGFYIGRYDIRYSTIEELQSGRSFQIVELNGAASEATSLYDARNSLIAAYKTLFRQWDLVFAIGAVNRERGSSSTPLSQVWRRWREYTQLASTYPAAD